MVTKNTSSYSAITAKFLTEDFENLLCVVKKQYVGQTSLTKEEVKFRLRTSKNLIQSKNAARGSQLAAAS